MCENYQINVWQRTASFEFIVQEDFKEKGRNYVWCTVFPFGEQTDTVFTSEICAEQAMFCL